MRDALSHAGVKVIDVDQFLQVDGMTTDQVGDLAAANHITIHELFAQRSSLEEAFMEMTRDSVEYQAHYEDEPSRESAALVGSEMVGGNK
jgi:ABC-2 type transport system ATP-binding protein